jgi:hypothetical protein
VFVDDSGSMNEGTKWADCAAIVQQGELHARHSSRERVQHFAVIELTTLFDTDGIQLEFMNSDVSQLGLTSSDACQALFESIRPAGYTPLSYSCERKIIEPFFQKCSQCSKADVKPIIIYIITGAHLSTAHHASHIIASHIIPDGAPTTDRGLATSVPTFAMVPPHCSHNVTKISTFPSDSSPSLPPAANTLSIALTPPMQLKRIDDTLTRLGLPRKTIGINVTQIGFDEGATTFLQQLDDHPM